MSGYHLELWRYGFLGTAEVHPLRRVQALIRMRGNRPMMNDKLDEAAVRAKIRKLEFDCARCNDAYLKGVIRRTIQYWQGQLKWRTGHDAPQAD